MSQPYFRSLRARMTCSSTRRTVAACLVACLLFSAADEAAEGADRKTRRSGSVKSRAASADEAQSGPQDYKSANFLLHTDLPKEEAGELLERLEKMLALISRYWGQPNRQVIECYVVRDLSKWPPGVLDPSGVASIRARAGVTITQKVTLGNRFQAKAVVYAVADRGTPQHEAVHAYCAQTFGTTGPVWYSEGMAEMGQYWRDDDFSVNAHDIVIRYLRSSEEKKSMNEIVNGDEQTGDSWENYAWRWALCHLLASNTNYQKRFQPLGMGLLLERPEISFNKVYGPMAREISFEYLFFLNHVEQGFRADLCSWDWKAKYRAPRGRSGLVARIEADHGWQPSRLKAKAGEEYAYSASGTWRTGKDAEPVNADGAADGTGRLMGVIFDDENYTLGEPFELGKYGRFKAEADGNLLLRCGDGWGALADNSGRLTVKLKSYDEKNPLPEPEDD
ncbi:MAG: hypothetical protein KDA79_00520 [Planctomycetaceae bacterium]|nr:hypothetical protein [Planctomycetaceae bacterium]